jgi:hypothetical protein
MFPLSAAVSGGVVPVSMGVRSRRVERGKGLI